MSFFPDFLSSSSAHFFFFFFTLEVKLTTHATVCTRSFPGQEEREEEVEMGPHEEGEAWGEARDIG